ncbi:ATP-binding protein [Roseivirga echinicomitans]|uniref:histidine kinase n=1 Tax=Roseivirga echinicomitans TaxID=296218 RepID=A0A150XUA8_9BACT|nr:ATP-binding protein [Roseivirga echinicomitans]KYG82264.1 hypothetical protein AWN68_15595 [Roseivirga echinicomitans]
MVPINKNIIDILQLYEFSMAIGKSFNYKENCDSLLKLIMSRKDLEACWIYSYSEEHCRVSYSIPTTRTPKLLECDKVILKDIHYQNKHISHPITQDIQLIAPLKLKGGSVAIFNLKDQGLLFLYSSRKQEFSQIELNQLSPIIDKFTLSLQGALIFSKREELLVSLEKQNQELSDYAHIVSHDLKSPIRNIEALTSWIKEDYKSVIDSSGIETFNLIGDNLEKMDNLIDGILRYSTIDKTVDEKHPINLNDLVAKTIETIVLPEHSVVKIICDLPVINGDAFRLQQLFQNLIENALKYNDKPAPLVEIGSREIEDGFEFFVRDNGKGIDKTHYDKIFQVFQSLDEDQKSTGIGLSVVKKIVSYYAGDIWLESKLNEGTTFYFTLKNDA